MGGCVEKISRRNVRSHRLAGVVGECVETSTTGSADSHELAWKMGAELLLAHEGLYERAHNGGERVEQERVLSERVHEDSGHVEQSGRALDGRAYGDGEHVEQGRVFDDHAYEDGGHVEQEGLGGQIGDEHEHTVFGLEANSEETECCGHNQHVLVVENG